MSDAMSEVSCENCAKWEGCHHSPSYNFECFERTVAAKTNKLLTKDVLNEMIAAASVYLTTAGYYLCRGETDDCVKQFNDLHGYIEECLSSAKKYDELSVSRV